MSFASYYFPLPIFASLAVRLCVLTPNNTQQLLRVLTSVSVNICGHIQVCGLTSSNATRCGGHLRRPSSVSWRSLLTTISMTSPPAHNSTGLILIGLRNTSISPRTWRQCLRGWLAVASRPIRRQRCPTTGTCPSPHSLTTTSLLCGHTSRG